MEFGVHRNFNCPVSRNSDQYRTINYLATWTR
jgi:hypothetical protein